MVDVKVDPNIHVDLSDFQDLASEIVRPSASKLAEKFERELLKVALDYGCSRVYYVDWTETENNTWHWHYMVFPFQHRKIAFELAKEKGTFVKIFNFKSWINMPYDEFERFGMQSKNFKLAKQVREKFRCKVWKPIQLDLL